MDLRWLVPLISDRCGLGPGSTVGEKGKKRGQMGKISASKASQVVSWGGGNYLLARFTRQFFSPFSHDAEPGPRLR